MLEFGALSEESCLRFGLYSLIGGAICQVRGPIIQLRNSFCHPCRLELYAGLAACVLAAAPAHAQRTGDNVTTQSSDAFGRSIGSEKNGLYNADDVRGFNPVDAGNARIEGLYFDQLDRLSPRLNESSAIRVGLSALHYPFPAPTGLIDYRITKSRGRRSLSVDFDNGSLSTLGPGGSFEFKLPLVGARIGLSGGAGLRNGDRTEGGQSLYRTFGGTLSWEPGDFSHVATRRGQRSFPPARNCLPILSAASISARPGRRVMPITV